MYSSGSGLAQAYLCRLSGLHIASISRLTMLLGELLGGVIDVNLQNESAPSPLLIACRDGQVASAKFLLHVWINRIYASNGSLYGTALHSAAAYGDAKLVEKLLLRGAKIEGLAAQFHAALYTASEARNLEVIQLLLKAGSNVVALTDTGTTSLYRAVRNGSPDVLDAIMQQDGNVNVSTWGSWTRLHEAAESDELAMAERLISTGADLLIENINGQTALDISQVLERH